MVFISLVSFSLFATVNYDELLQFTSQVAHRHLVDFGPRRILLPPWRH
jgi:hypothetical protein